MVLIVASVVRRLPWRLALAFGTALGLCFYVFDGPHRRLAMANLQAAFPLRTPAECREIARATFGHFGRLLVELLRFSALSRETMVQLIEVEGRERMEQAHARGLGVLMFSGHFGFWELQGIGHSVAVERPMAVLARPLDNPYLHAMLERMRTCTGNTVMYRRGAIRRVLRELGANGGVAIMIDQHIQSADAIYVDFFNRPAATTSAVAAIALRTGAPIIPVFALPLPGGCYRLIYEHPVEPPAPDHPDPIREFTQRCTDVLEMYVRRYPDLWLWMHRRWRDVEPAVADVPGMFPAGRPDEPAQEADG